MMRNHRAKTHSWYRMDGGFCFPRYARIWKWAMVASMGLLTLVMLADLVARHPISPDQQKPCHLADIKKAEEKAKIPSVIASFGKGQVGNQMSSLATLLAFQQLHGVQPHVTQEQVDLLSHYFDIYSLGLYVSMVLETACPVYESLPWINPFREVDNNTKQYSFSDPDVWETYKFNHLLDAGEFPNDVAAFKGILPLLRQKFKLRKKFSDSARETLLRAKAIFLAGHPELSSVTYVSIHCRRTNYMDHLRVLYGVEEANETYIHKAMEFYRRTFQNVIFILVSDDMEWMEEKFHGLADAYIPTKCSCNQSAFWQQSTWQPCLSCAGNDLALLSSVNHSILTYGTFGMWGALLTNGKAVLPKDYMMTKESKEIMEGNLDGWTFI